jgi:hypothetical protein
VVDALTRQRKYAAPASSDMKTKKQNQKRSKAQTRWSRAQPSQLMMYTNWRLSTGNISNSLQRRAGRDGSIRSSSNNAKENSKSWHSWLDTKAFEQHGWQWACCRVRIRRFCQKLSKEGRTQYIFLPVNEPDFARPGQDNAASTRANSARVQLLVVGRQNTCHLEWLNKGPR